MLGVNSFIEGPMCLEYTRLSRVQCARIELVYQGSNVLGLNSFIEGPMCLDVGGSYKC